MKVFRTPPLRDLSTGLGIVAHEFERASSGIHDDVTVVLANHGPWIPKHIVWLFWETSKPPQSWKLAGLRHTWTPTRYCQDIFRRSGIDSEIVPVGVNPAYFYLKRDSGPERSELYKYKHLHLERRGYEHGICRIFPQLLHRRGRLSSFRFLYPFDWIERKGPDVALRAFAEEFSSEDDVELVFCNFRLCTWTPMRMRSPGELMPQLHKAKPNLAKITMLVSFPRYPDIAELYRFCDCLVAPFRGQAVSMPVMEAMACGVPAITTDFGGTSELVTEELGWRIKVKEMVPVRLLDWFAPYQGQDLGVYAEPDVDDLKRCMREASDDAERTRRKGEKASEFILSNYTWEKTALRAREYVEKEYVQVQDTR